MNMTLTSISGSIVLPEAVLLAKHYGPYFALLALGMLLILWRERKTDARLINRIRMLEEEIDNTYLPLTKERIR